MNEAMPAVRLGFVWMLQRPARVIACGFGSGLIRPAPGTWGTLFGWAAYVLIERHLPASWMMLPLAAIAFAIGVWACGQAGRDLGVADHGGFVWDEVVAIWLVLALIPAGPWHQLGGFVVFRVFDILKPQPIRYFDAKWKSGFGVMFDDLLAAGYTVLVFAFYVRFVT